MMLSAISIAGLLLHPPGAKQLPPKDYVDTQSGYHVEIQSHPSLILPTDTLVIFFQGKEIERITGTTITIEMPQFAAHPSNEPFVSHLRSASSEDLIIGVFDQRFASVRHEALIGLTPTFGTLAAFDTIGALELFPQKDGSQAIRYKDPTLRNTWIADLPLPLVVLRYNPNAGYAVDPAATAQANHAGDTVPVDAAGSPDAVLSEFVRRVYAGQSDIAVALIRAQWAKMAATSLSLFPTPEAFVTDSWCRLSQSPSGLAVLKMNHLEVAACVASSPTPLEQWSKAKAPVPAAQPLSPSVAKAAQETSHLTVKTIIVWMIGGFVAFGLLVVGGQLLFGLYMNRRFRRNNE